MKYLSNATFTLILLSFSLSLHAHEGAEHYGPHMMWQGYGMMMGPFMMILFIAAIIVVGVLVLRWLGGHGIGSGSSTSSNDDPVETLKMRLARGEIDSNEYHERLRILQNK